MRLDLLEFLEGLRSARAIEDAAAALGRLWRQAGFDLTFVAPLRGGGRRRPRHGQDDPRAWPEAEKRRYRALRCWEFDPLVRHCLTADGAHFVHNEALRERERRLPRHRRVLEREFSALWPARAVVSARDRDGTAWMLAAAGPLGRGELSEVSDQLSGLLTVSGRACEARMSRLGPAEPDGARTRLSRRERECLLWLAAGLRNDRIAERLGIRGATVELHLRNARRKLGARTREQAVARAVALGLVDP